MTAILETAVTGIAIIAAPVIILAFIIAFMQTVHKLRFSFKPTVREWGGTLAGMTLLIVFAYLIGWVACKYGICLGGPP